jgi:hypothetical protein
MLILLYSLTHMIRLLILKEDKFTLLITITVLNLLYASTKTRAKNQKKCEQ